MPFVKKPASEIPSTDKPYIIVKKNSDVVGYMTCSDHIPLLDETFSVTYNIDIEVKDNDVFLVWSDTIDEHTSDGCCVVS